VVALKPSIFPGVPRVWQRIYDRISAQIDQTNALKKFMFNRAFNAKLEHVRRGSVCIMCGVCVCVCVYVYVCVGVCVLCGLEDVYVCAC